MIDITNTIQAITGTDSDEAIQLQERAEARIRLYLNYQEEESISRFSSSIVDIACALYEQKKAEAEAMKTAGLKSESFSEGGVSTKKDYADISSLTSFYNQKITVILDYLKPYRRGRVYGTNRK